MAEFDKAARRKELEITFCALLNDKLGHENAAKAAHDEMLRVQGELRCLDAIPDGPQG